VRPLIAEVGGRRALITYLRGIPDEDAVRTAIEEVDGAVYFDQRRFVQEVYGEYRERTVGVVVSGCFAVLGLLWLRYRRLRPSLAAFLPSLVVALALAALAVAFDTRVSLLHLIGLVLVMGIGVDYGIFVVDSQEDSRQVGVTMLNLLLAALTTLLVFGVLALSEHPILNALGFTAGLGVLLAFLLAPLALLIVTRPPGSRS
jgi:predicted exporter